jgi:hypothetical protein
MRCTISCKPEAPHSAPQFRTTRNRRGHSRLVSSPREHLDTSAAGVPVGAGQRPRGRSAAADATAPRWVVKPAHPNCWHTRMCSSSASCDHVWCELHTHMHAARNPREHESRHCILTPSGCVTYGLHHVGNSDASSIGELSEHHGGSNLVSQVSCDSPSSMRLLSCWLNTAPYSALM